MLMVSSRCSFPTLGLSGLPPSLSGAIEEAVTIHTGGQSNVSRDRNLCLAVGASGMEAGACPDASRKSSHPGCGQLGTALASVWPNIMLLCRGNRCPVVTRGKDN